MRGTRALRGENDEFSCREHRRSAEILPRFEISKTNVPIARILKIEAETLNMTQQEQERVIRVYEVLVTGIMNAVREKWKIPINKIPEDELFEFLTEALGGRYMQDSLITHAVLDKKYDCYSSSIILADVCSRLGKELRVGYLGKHIFLIGDEHYFETTTYLVSSDSRYSAVRKDDEYFRDAYSKAEITNLEGLLFPTGTNCFYMFYDRGNAGRGFDILKETADVVGIPKNSQTLGQAFERARRLA